MIDFSQDATDASASPSGNSEAVKQLTSLVIALNAADEEAEIAAQALKDANERARKLREEDIPGLMSELAIARIMLDNGLEVKVADDVYASIPAANKENAFSWLEQNNFGGLIKTEVEIKFGKGEMEKAVAMFAQLQAQFGESVALTRGVHPQTLKAFLREQITNGKDVPLELFGARAVKIAKVTAPKLKKPRA